MALTPARHYSGRGILDRDTTLWGGWVILGEKTRLYTSGDGGYGAHFKEIGKKYGPLFTLANHGWKEPIERAVEGAKKAEVNLITPKIGETVLLDKDLHIPSSAWWDLNLGNK